MEMVLPRPREIEPAAEPPSTAKRTVSHSTLQHLSDTIPQKEAQGL